LILCGFDQQAQNISVNKYFHHQQKEINRGTGNHNQHSIHDTFGLVFWDGDSLGALLPG
jgi:hypothetical protein